MRLHFTLASALATTVAIAAPAHAGDQILQGAIPSWVKMHDAAATPDASDAQQLLLKDIQVFHDLEKNIQFDRQVVRFGSPEGLRNATVRLEWDPEQQEVTVHRLWIIRGDEVIDVLAEGQEFTILRRETELEKATLNGRLTGLIQPEGLEVGDVIDFAYTIVTTDQVIKGSMGSWFRLGDMGNYGTGHVSLLYPRGHKVDIKRWPLTEEPKITRDGDLERVSWTLGKLDDVDLPVRSPSRSRMFRYTEYSDYGSWANVAEQMRPHYDATAKIEEGSRLAAEADKIAAATDDPVRRAEMALELVQERVRYVNLSLGAGGLVPADAETTWRRRYGDCKGKTVLLMALLHRLGIDAVPALVAINGDDALGERLPSVSPFDHVMVRSVINGKTYWLDGTRNGDTRLALIQVPDMDFALPIVPDADLVALAKPPLSLPSMETHTTVDYSNGLLEPGIARVEVVMRGSLATIIERNWDQVEERMLEGWEREFGGEDEVDFEFGGRDYDEEAQTLTLRATVTAKEADYGYYLGSGVTDPSFFVPEEREDVDLNIDAPFTMQHPQYELETTTFLLPEGGTSLTAIVGGDINYTINGEQFERTVVTEADRIVVTTIERSLVDEIPYQASIDNADKAEAYNSDIFYIQPNHWNLPEDQIDDLLAAADHLETKELEDDEEREEEMITDMRHSAALAYARLGRTDEANALFDSLREEAAGAQDLNSLCWNKAVANIEIDRALEECDAAIASQRDAVNALDSRGLVHLRHGNFEAAVADYSSGIDESEEGEGAHMLYGRALAYRALGKIEESDADIAAAMEIQPGIAATYRSYGISLDTFVPMPEDGHDETA